MNVLHIPEAFYPSLYGGVGELTYELALGLTNIGVTVRVVTTNDGGPSGPIAVPVNQWHALAPDLKVWYVSRAAAPLAIRLLRDAIRWADVVHLTGVYAPWTAEVLLLCRLLRRPLVWSPAGHLQRSERSQRTITKQIWTAACMMVRPRTLVFHVTSDLEAAMSTDIVQHAPVRMIPLGVRVPARQNPRTASSTLRLLYLGRLVPLKGVDLLLDACARIEKEKAPRPWRLRIAGTGPSAYVTLLHTRVAHHGIDRQVEFLGEIDRDRRETVFSETDLLVLSSFQESFGMVVVEALAHGVPVIASRGTPWHVIVDVGCGFWVDNTPHALSEAIVHAMRSPLGALGDRGRTWVGQTFTWERTAHEMARLYADVLAGAVGVGVPSPGGDAVSR